MIRIVGDVHECYKEYLDKVECCDYSLQVGDMGLSGYESLRFLAPSQHKFFFGNHDNPDKYVNCPNFLGRFGIWKEMFYLGGAWSIDKAFRTAGVDWWGSEELSYEEADRALDLYEKTKPSVVITHDGPNAFTRCILQEEPIRTHTGNILNKMFDIHKPDMWIHGHFHIPCERNILGTRFISLGILEYIDIPEMSNIEEELNKS